MWALFGDSVVPESVNAFLDEVLVVQSAVSFFASPNKKGSVTQLLKHHFFTRGHVTGKCCLSELNPKLTSLFNFPFWLVAFLFALGLYVLSHFILRFNFAFTMFSLEAGHHPLSFTFRNQVYTPGSPGGLRHLGWVWLETWEGVQLTLQTADRKVIIWTLTLSAFKTALPPWLRGACRHGGSSTQI